VRRPPLRLLILAAAALLGASACEAQPSTRGCGRHGAVVSDEAAARPLPGLTGRVVDMADLLPAPAEQRITGELEALEAATTDQLVVVTVPELDGEPIESLGLRLGLGWGIGQESVDNGVLLIVAPRDRHARIEVGCGLEGLLTDERAQQIMDDELIPRFADGEFEQGIDAGVTAIAAVLRSDRRRPQPWQEKGTS